MGKTILFLYGTLKRGMKANVLLGGQDYLGPARTVAQYRLYHLGRYPGLVFDPDNGLEVKGELWAVDEEIVRLLDEYEGAPELFARADVAVADFFEPVQGYLYNQPVSPGTPSGDEWPFAE